MRYLIIILIFCFACSEEEFSAGQFQKYVDQFELEAKKNGHKINYDGLKIIAGTKFKNGIEAYYDPNVHIIYIDTASYVWKSRPEETMAHELGHAVLNRQHDFSRLKNGMYKSVMGNYSNATYSGWTAHDSIGYRKDYYYKELFNPNTPDPNW